MRLREWLGNTCSQHFAYESLTSLLNTFLMNIIAVTVFLSHCCFQEIVLNRTHDLYLLCPQFSSPFCCRVRGKRRRELGNSSVVRRVSVGAQIRGIPYLNHDTQTGYKVYSESLREERRRKVLCQSLGNTSGNQCRRGPIVKDEEVTQILKVNIRVKISKHSTIF